ncbi:Pentatricopeptide repeat-containing protein At1g62680 [Durusdinium trenchii]|uniref:Mitochondrial n=2 Tax=Durusdinium trenchii TaxID=1381693 RepID=A0ABP0IBG1_9DINO
MMAGRPDVQEVRDCSKISWEAALSILARTWAKKCLLDTKMIGPVLSASARSHQWRVALALLGIPMKSPPGEIAFNSVANACEKSGEWQQTIAVVATMSDIRLATDSFSYCTMMSALCKGQKWKEVLLVYKQLEEKGIEKNTILCGAAINACAKGHLWNMASKLLASMADEQIQRSLVTFSSVISAFSASACWTRALEILQEMERKSLVYPDQIAFSALIAACGNASQWKEAGHMSRRCRML